MGNYISCTTLTTSTRPKPTAQVILPNSDVRQVSSAGCGPHAAAAADLMLDFPGHFLVDSASLHAGRRFVPLSADEELEGGHVYVMFPMARVNALVDAADLGRLAVGAVRLARVLPAPAPPPEVRVEVDDDVDGDMAGELVMGRLSVCRSWRPALEPIMEECVPHR